jgi:hypothetical protein
MEAAVLDNAWLPEVALGSGTVGALVDGHGGKVWRMGLRTVWRHGGARTPH